MLDLPRDRFESEDGDRLDAVTDKYQSQSEKLKRVTKELKCDDDKQSFKERLKKNVKQKPVDKAK